MVSVELVVTAYSANHKSGAGVDKAKLLLLLAVLLRNTMKTKYLAVFTPLFLSEPSLGDH